MSQVMIIAEAGVNHNGNLAMAKQLVDVAADAGADAIKFQTFIAQKLVSKYAPKAEYQKATTAVDENQLQMIQKLQLKFADFVKIQEYCTRKNLLFLSTAFDLDSLKFLEEIDIPMHKIPSGEITNLPYLRAIARTGKPVILSTGMSTLDEIHDAFNVLRKDGICEISLLHCSSAYPTPFKDANLKAMKTLHEIFSVPVGYSDHTLGIEISIAAVALGACIIEKHFTLDRNLSGPDHKASLVPDELTAMVQAIRNVEKALGNGLKIPSESEQENIYIARKSIVAAQKIKAGEGFTPENVTTKRPGNGISPMRWGDVLQMKAKRDFEEDEMIEL